MRWLGISKFREYSIEKSVELIRQNMADDGNHFGSSVRLTETFSCGSPPRDKPIGQSTQGGGGQSTQGGGGRGGQSTQGGGCGGQSTQGRGFRSTQGSGYGDRSMQGAAAAAAGAGRTEAAGACRGGDCGVRSSGSVELTLLALLVSPLVPLAIGLT
jgi:hypothetical protein